MELNNKSFDDIFADIFDDDLQTTTPQVDIYSQQQEQLHNLYGVIYMHQKVIDNLVSQLQKLQRPKPAHIPDKALKLSAKSSIKRLFPLSERDVPVKRRVQCKEITPLNACYEPKKPNAKQLILTLPTLPTIKKRKYTKKSIRNKYAPPYTQREDKLLGELYKKYGSDWVTISKNYYGPIKRNKKSLMGRVRYLERRQLWGFIYGEYENTIKIDLTKN